MTEDREQTTEDRKQKTGHVWSGLRWYSKKMDELGESVFTELQKMTYFVEFMLGPPFRPMIPGLVLIFCFVVPALFGFRLNLTGSLPFGIYREMDDPFERGSFAMFCLEDTEFIQLVKERGYLGKGSCPGGLEPLGKEISGLPGDVVSLENGLIAVNGKTIPLSEVKTTDSQGRAMPVSKLAPGVIPEGYALMLSDHHAGGFDSRYFGLVRLSGLRPVKPVFTW